MTPAQEAAIRRQSIPGQLERGTDAGKATKGAKSKPPATPADLVSERRSDTPSSSWGAAGASPVVEVLLGHLTTDAERAEDAQRQYDEMVTRSGGRALSEPPYLWSVGADELPNVDERVPVEPLPQQATHAGADSTLPVELIPGELAFSPIESPEDVRNALLDKALDANMQAIDGLTDLAKTPPKKPFPTLPLALAGLLLFGG